MVTGKRYARKLAKRLNQEKQKNRSWRAIASDYPAVVKPGTLCRIAKSGGAWLPKDLEILMALGLVRERSPFAILPRWFHQIPEALEFFKGQKEHVKQMSTDTRKAAKGSR